MVDRIVMLHGFAQTGACLGPLAVDLAADHEVVLPDLPGHGAAAAEAERNCPAAAALLADSCGRGVWIGYSLGGRVALHVALERPEVVDALVLVGATAGIEDPARREARREVDLARAARVQEVGVSAFVAEWLAMDMFAGLPDWARFDEERSSNDAEGLAGSLRHAGTGSMVPLWDRLGEVTVPVLCVAGARDAAFVAASERIAVAVPRGVVAVIPAVGHAAHLEDPPATIAAVRSFLAGISGARPGPR